MAALGLAPSLGCEGERCLVQSRAIQHEAQSSGDGRVGRGFLELAETRAAENAAWVLWHVRVTPFAGTATTVVLRQGTPQAPGAVLYRFPVVNSAPDSGVLTQVFVRTAYAGEVPFDQLWDLVQSQPVSFEVVFDGGVAPLRIGPLLRTGFSDWQDACS